jgi:hypothetical protein
MKCFTLEAGYTITPAYSHPMVGMAGRVHFDAYPRVLQGIVLHEDRTVVIGWRERIAVSDELLRLPPASGAIKREGSQVTILRCSVGTDRSGKKVLVPEKDDDRGNALVKLDQVGAGRYLGLYLKAQPSQVVARVIEPGSRWDGADDHMLAAMKPFEPVTAVRTDRKWIFWGEEKVKEQLSIVFDGATIFFDIVRVREAS